MHDHGNDHALKVHIIESTTKHPILKSRRYVYKVASTDFSFTPVVLLGATILLTMEQLLLSESEKDVL